MVCKLIEEEESAGGEITSLMDYLESCLRHKSEMVIYEAAHAIVNLRRTGPRELAPAISVLQLFCSSPKPALRFAAVRTLSNVSVVYFVLRLFVSISFMVIMKLSFGRSQ